MIVNAVFVQSTSQRADRNYFNQRVDWGLASAAAVNFNSSIRISQSDLSADNTN